MRNELSLIVVVLLILITEIFSAKKSHSVLLNLATALFGLHTILGFLPAHSCLTADQMGGYLSTEGQHLNHLRQS